MIMNRNLLLVCLLVFLTRLPFLSDGFGHEEDSWGLALNALRMYESGDYEASRLPGHPLQEYVYSFLASHNSPFLFNLLSALMSTLAVFFFGKILEERNIPLASLAALTLGMVPVFFAAGTYTIDYTWAAGLALGSGYFLITKKYWLSGVFLGLAAACRITSGAWILCFLPLMNLTLFSKESAIGLGKVAALSLIVGLIFYIPVIMRYGPGFFMYYDQFPYPNIFKLTYKMTIGVWGILGSLALMIFLAPALASKNGSRKVSIALLVAIFIFGAAYLRLPQKSGYMIPLIPFALLFYFERLRGKWLYSFSALMILSPWIFGMNLSDPYRGAASSGLEVRFQIAGQEIFMDPVYGPIFNERSKRINKETYTRKIEGLFLNEFPDQPPVIIAGWWYNELKYRQHFNPNFNAILEFYISEQKLKEYKVAGNPVYALPEQILYNDLYSGIQSTSSYAIPLEIK